MLQVPERLASDLDVLEAMASEMDEYLWSDVLFWPMARGSMPRLTLGGYLMRQGRLMALRGALDEESRARLETAIETFNEALVEKVVRFEQRAHQELQARIRQWGEHMKELDREASGGQYYSTTAETRTIISALLDKLRMPPYQLDERAVRELVVYDNKLRKRWKPGDFIWPEVWGPAYPRDHYWWLYGRPL